MLTNTNPGPDVMKPLVKFKMMMACVVVVFTLSACQSNPLGVPGGVPGGSPLPSIPSGGGTSGSPSSDPSAPPPPGTSSGEGEGDSGSPPPGSEGEGNAETSPDWEEEVAGEGDSDAAQDSEVTFEEPGDDAAAGDEVSDENEVSFEEPEFADDGGLTEEELDALEKELNESLGDFDEEIQREKTFAEERANDNVDDEPLGGVGVFETYEEERPNRNAGQSTAGSANSSADSSSSTNSASDGSASDNAGTVAGDQSTNSQGVGDEADEVVPTAPDIPDDIVDDDIVARQIREAAENETDPELREKLWAEYRKYKNQ